MRILVPHADEQLCDGTQTRLSAGLVGAAGTKLMCNACKMGPG